MILLGSTGSIGQNALIIAKRFSLNVDVLVAGNNLSLLNEQIASFKPSRIVIANVNDISKVNHPNVSAGQEAILDAIQSSESSLVINALVGFLGLKPTLKAIECGKRVALANKESLVAGGAFVDTSMIQPIDSEHFGLWFLLQDRPISRMQITASGGAFRDWPLDKLAQATLADTQKHPNWSMGQKITIDSATMMNKLFELIEARWLFGKGKYDAIIETQSLMHAMIDFTDGSTTAHFANANMQLPIAHALGITIDAPILESVDFVKISNLEFRQIEKERYPIWEIKDQLLEQPDRGLILNAANEAAIELFVDKKIGFMDIAKKAIQAFEHFDSGAKSLDEVFVLDKEVRAFVKQ
ncbi:MAG: 1-deoxy-D-xylulose-5-phosphate reductoisomerase [Thiovulaceae bacterium]|nr:1-deoxy-D-xylulose-5-phosphate reductoisomerase [Sulfurimonadaceae bacterium]